MLNIEYNEDVHYKKWIGFVEEALSNLDFENKKWIHLPNSGGYYEQDDFFLAIWEYIKFEFFQALNDKEFMSYRDKKNGKS